MYKVDPSRHEVAKTLARIIQEGRHSGALVEWTDADEIEGPTFPYVRVGAGPVDDRISLGRDADARAWDLGLSSAATNRLTGWDLDWIFGCVARFAPQERQRLRRDATPAEWLISIAYQCADYGWSARHDVVAIASSELEARAATVSQERAVHLYRFANTLRARNVLESGRALLEFGNHLREAAELELAAHAYLVAYEAALHVVDSTLGARAAGSLGRVLRRLGRWEDAFRWYHHTIELAAFDDELVTLAYALNGLATGHADRGSTPRARDYSAQAVGVAIASGDSDVLGAAYRGAAMVHRISGNLTEGAALAWKAAEVTKDPGYRANSLIQLGSILLDSGQALLAEKAYQLGLAALEPGSSGWVATLDAIAYISALRYDGARYDELYASVAPLVASTEPRDQVQLLFSRAKAQAALGRLEEARAAHRATIGYARSHGFLQFSERSTIELEEIPDPPLADERTERIGGWLAAELAQLPLAGA